MGGARVRSGWIAPGVVALAVSCGSFGEAGPAAPLDGGSEAGAAGSCQFAQDCPQLATEPPDCAVADCVAGACTYRAVDQDQDGHPSARCASKAGAVVVLGDDCADDDSQLFPGLPVPCSEAEDGSPIGFPNGTPVGACKYGTKICEPGGTVSACKGAVGPRAVTACTQDVDEGCTGSPLEMCPCVAGETQPCGTTAVGNCRKGHATCKADNTFGPCAGNVEPGPLQCGTATDFDCNGVADNAETACRCPGGSAPGISRACNSHPQDGVGACKAGTQSCVAAGSTSSWSACTGAVGPASEGCDAADRDCNGTAGVNEPAPPPPAGAVNCAKIFRCSASGRGALYYRTNIGWTNYAGADTVWTGYAPRGDYSSGTYPAGTHRIGRDTGTGKKMGPYGVASACCASGCPSVLYDAGGQFYTPL